MLAAAQAQAKPRVTLLTALPLVWGEGSPDDILRGRSGRAAVLRRLDTDFAIEPVDVLDRRTLRGVVVLAQPRRLDPGELVAFDDWVRAGGRALIFADPRLDWPSAHALGDPRRAPPVTLLDPLLDHWGLQLASGAESQGTWRTGSNCTASQAEVIDCAIGRGRVVLVADADLLDERRDDAGEQAAWVAATLSDLAGRPHRRVDWVPLVGATGAIGSALYLHRRREHRKNLSKTE